MTIADYPAYESYRDTGVDWLGNVPSQWTITRLGTVFTERRSKVSDKDYEPLSVTKNGILQQLDSAAKTNDGDNRKLVKKGDFVINSRSDRKGSSGISTLDGSVSLINIVLQPNGIDPIFCNYILKSYAFVEEYYRMGHGIVADLWTTRYDEMRGILMALPTSTEQRAIATFLDEKCAGIGEAVRIKEQEIYLLRERRQILIQEAVTRGLDPAAPMKDSGIDWIGKIPMHWEVKPLKRICEAFGRIGFRGYSTTDLVDAGEGAITLSPSNLSSDEMEFGKCTYLSWPKYNESPEIQIFDGDILIVKTGSTFGKTGFVRGLPQPATINPQLLVLKNVKCHSEFLYHFISSAITQSEVKRRVIGSTIPTISETRILGIKIPLPPVADQSAIVARIDDVSKEIDDVIAIKERQITALKEYKTSLINSAVTGKIKVI